MLSIYIDPSIVVNIIIILLVIFSILFLFKNQIDELMTHIRKNNILHSKLKKFCKDNDYIFLKNIVLPTEDGKKIKIDDLILADKYIYVISQKILYGNISGIDSDAKWIIRTLKDAKYFTNPLLSNDIRVSTIAKLTKVDYANFVNVVCFSKTAFIKDVMVNNSTRILTNIDKIEQEILKKEKNSSLNDFLPEEIEKIAGELFEISQNIFKK